MSFDLILRDNGTTTFDLTLQTTSGVGFVATTRGRGRRRTFRQFGPTVIIPPIPESFYILDEGGNSMIDELGNFIVSQ